LLLQIVKSSYLLTQSLKAVYVPRAFFIRQNDIANVVLIVVTLIDPNVPNAHAAKQGGAVPLLNGYALILAN